MHICFYSFRSSRPKYKTHYICKTTEKWCFYSMFSKEKRCKKTVFFLSDVVFSNVAKKGSDVLECCRLIRAVMTSFVTSKPLKCPATFWNIRAVLWLWSKAYSSFTFHQHFIYCRNVFTEQQNKRKAVDRKSNSWGSTSPGQTRRRKKPRTI